MTLTKLQNGKKSLNENEINLFKQFIKQAHMISKMKTTL